MSGIVTGLTVLGAVLLVLSMIADGKTPQVNIWLSRLACFALIVAFAIFLATGA